MIKEVFIDKQRVDVDQSKNAGYMFESPIFRDISKILSNRTTTYKLPNTTRNTLLFGFSDNPESLSDFRYKEHDIEEWRDGLLFIRGKCALLEYKGGYFEFRVIWGNTIRLLGLKDKNLRDYTSMDFLQWNSTSQFVTPTEDHKGRGFVYADFGKGTTDMQYIHPSVTIRYILDHIQKRSGVKFEYPNRFEEIFKNRWIPLTEKNANEATWLNYIVELVPIGLGASSAVNHSPIRFNAVSGKTDMLVDERFIKMINETPIHCWVNISFDNISLSSNQTDRLVITVRAYGAKLYKKEFILQLNNKGYYSTDVYLECTLESTLKDDYVQVSAYIVGTNNEPTKLPSGTTISRAPGELSIFRNEPKEVPFGDKYPIAPNLPNMKVIDFLKSLMQMYGLFTYYNFRNDDVVEFISIDDMYAYKKQAYDWTHKLIKSSNGQRFSVSSRYGEYASENYVDYDNEEDIINNKTGGSIIIKDTTIDKTKELFTLPYSASDNITDDNGTYAYIKLYDEDGDIQTLKTRVFTEGRYSDNLDRYVSAYFDDNQKFNGSDGLLKKYYSKYQEVLLNPIIVEFRILFSEMDLFQYREVYPIYIDGTYYMPISLTVQTDNVCTCKAIKM